MMKNQSLRITAALFLAGGALLLTGCQAATPAPAMDRTLNVTSLPSPVDEGTSDKDPGQSVGMDLHVGPATFGINCSTDSVGDSTRGTAALVCTWNSQPR